MKKTICLVLIAAFLLSLASCGKHNKPIVLCDRPDLLVVRKGRDLTIVDRETGREYALHVKRVRSHTSGQIEKRIIKNDSLTVYSVGDILCICRPGSAGYKIRIS